MNKFILISIALLCLLAVLNINTSKTVPEEYQAYDSLLRDFCRDYSDGELDKAKDDLKASAVFVKTDPDDRLDPVIIIDLSNNGNMLDQNLRRIVFGAFGQTEETTPLSEDKTLNLKAYSDNRYFLDRAQQYKEKIEAMDEHLNVEIVTEGPCDLREEFLSFDPYGELSMFLPGSSLMREIGISHE